MKVSKIEKNFEGHLELFRTSKLSKAEYCRTNKLSYHRFSYWVKKRLKSAAVLVPVQIKSSIQHNADYAGQLSKVLCTLDFGRNGCLKIYDMQAMASILERLV